MNATTDLHQNAMHRTFHTCSGSGAQKQRGGVSIEVAIMANFLILACMLILQIGLIYHGKLVVNYAAFEAARRGAVNHASVSAMRDEAGFRLAPLMGGDGSREGAMLAIARSSASVMDPLATRLNVLSPTPSAFDDWGVTDNKTNRRFIPNAHLNHQSSRAGRLSGVSLQDANLLKLELVHGYRLRVPVAGALIAKAMMRIDPGNIHFYARGKFPLSSVATVRMQSDAWESASAQSSDSGNSMYEGQHTVAELDDESDSAQAPLPPVEPADGPQASQTNQPGEDTTQEALVSAEPIEGEGSELAGSGNCVDVSGESQSHVLVSTLDYERYLAGY
ncbi:MAG: TadE/TadG family type IV pilus assembly protein [Granulosicoccus sp.]